MGRSYWVLGTLCEFERVLFWDLTAGEDPLFLEAIPVFELLSDRLEVVIRRSDCSGRLFAD